MEKKERYGVAGKLEK